MKKLLFRRIASRVTFVVFLALSPVFAFLFFSSYQQYHSQKQSVQDSALKLVRVLKSTHIQTIEDAKGVLRAMAQFPIFSKQPSQRCDFLRRGFSQAFPRYAEIMLTAPNGRILCSTKPLEPQAHFNEMPFLAQIIDRRDVGVGPYRFDKTASASYAMLGIPLLNVDNQVDVLLFASLNLSNFEAIPPMAQLSIDSVIFVFDSSGLMLARYPDPEGWKGTTRIVNSPIVRAAMNNLGDEGLVDLIGADKVPRMFAYTKIHKTANQTVYLAIGIPVDVAYANARESFQKDLLMIACLMLLVIGAVWVSTQRLVARKMHSLMNTINQLNNGDLSARVGFRRSADELGRLGSSINQMAQSIETRVLSLQRRGNELRDLKEMSDAMQACATQDEVLAIVRQFALRLFPAQPGTLYLMHPSTDHFETRASWQNPSAMHDFLPQDCWAVRRGKIYRVEADTGQPRCHHVHDIPTTSYMCVPLMVHGEMLGILHLENDQVSALADEQPLALAFVEHTALTLANLRLRDTLQAQAMRDGLTGLFNRRFMEESLLRETRRASRNRSPVSMIMIDIDHFKRFNDTFGHAAGDALLRAVGEMLKAEMRGSDLACRYGGEEFTVILPATALESSAEIAEKLRKKAKLIEVSMDGRALSTITISLGVASFPLHGDTWEKVLHAADLALMHAKQTRDRAIAYNVSELEIRRQTRR